MRFQTVAAHAGTRRVEYLQKHSDIRGLADYIGLDLSRPAALRLRRGVDINAVRADIGSRAEFQHNVAENSRAGVPAGIRRLVGDPEQQFVFSLVEEIGDIVLKRGVAVGPGAGFLSVDEQCGVHINAVKIEQHPARKLFRRAGEGTPVPALAGLVELRRVVYQPVVR